MARILIIDDDDNLRDLLRLVLQREGHTTDQARDGLEGMRASAQSAYDLVLCDILMPEREGLETIRELRRTRPELPVIAMSGGMPGGVMDPLAVAALLGACHTLPKPFRIDELVRTVSEVLAAHRPGAHTPLPGDLSPLTELSKAEGRCAAGRAKSQP